MHPRGGDDAPGPALAGRQQDLHVVERFLASTGRSGDDGTGVLVVSGDPGIGKTALLDLVGHRAASRGTRVLRATGIESEVDIGFAAVTQLLGPAQALLPRLPHDARVVLEPVLGRSGGAPAATDRVARAVLVLLDAAADALPGREESVVPVLAVVDDLQWIDRASADVLGEVARLLDPRRARMVVAERTAARTYFDTTPHPRLIPSPLDDEAAEELLRRRFPALSPGGRQRVVAAAGGNPLALLELPTRLDDMTPGDPAAQVSGHLALTQRLQSLFGDRVVQLPPETRHFLLMAALDQGDDAAPLPYPDEGLRIMAPAQRATLVEFDSATSRVEFRHPLVRATVVSLSTSQERRHAHRSLAARLHGQDDRAAWHLAAATVQPDEEVAALLEAAAGRARRRGDAPGAVRGLIRAAQLSPRPDQRARRLAKAAYQGADVDGDLQRAAALLGQARSADPGSPGTLQAAVATAYLLLNGSGDTHTAHQVLLGALEAAHHAGPIDPAVHADALQTLCEICLYAADQALWPTFWSALEALPLDRFPVLELWVRAMADPVRNALPALPDLDRALEGLHDETDPATVQRLATAGVFVDRVEGARESLTRLVEQAGRGEAIPAGIVALMLLSLTDFTIGQWQRASDGVEEGLRLADVHGFALLSWPLKYTQALVAAATGDHAAVVRLTDQMLAWSVPRRVGTVQHYADRALGLDALGRGDHQEAYRAFSRICPPGRLPPHQGHALWVVLELVEAAVRAGDDDAARAHVRAVRDAGVERLSPRLALLVAGAEAIAAPSLDHELFHRALTLPQASHHPFELARVQLVYGQRLRRARAVKEARAQLTSAHDLFRDLRAHPWRRRASDELLATNQGRTTSTLAGPASLTAQELRIATLAAAGSTNKEIADLLLISPRTVGAHLQHVFGKLDVRSRAGLHRALGGPGEDLG